MRSVGSSAKLRARGKLYPQMVTRIVIDEYRPPTSRLASLPNSGTKFPATYIHHCHFLEHEDDAWSLSAPSDEIEAARPVAPGVGPGLVGSEHRCGIGWSRDGDGPGGES
jgi:hypothetical protein